MISYRHPGPHEREAAFDLVAESFPHDRAREPRVRADLLVDPEYAPERAIVAVDGRRLVGHALGKSTLLFLAGKPLPVVRIGTVCAAPNRRRSGIGRGVVEGAAALVEKAGGVILNPAPEPYVRVFYERLGFVAAVRTESLYEIAAADLPELPSDVPIRPAVTADEPLLNQLYERHYAPQTGTLSRSTDWWERRISGRELLWSAYPPQLHVASRGGRLVAYLVHYPVDDFRVWEWAAEPGATREALALLSWLAGRTGARFAIRIQRRDPLFPLLWPADPTDATPPTKPVMVRAADLDVLIPVLTEIVEEQGAELTAGDEAVVSQHGAVLRASWSQLLALTYDGRRLREMAQAEKVRVQPLDEEAMATMQRVFPARVSGRRPTDAY